MVCCHIGERRYQSDVSSLPDLELSFPTRLHVRCSYSISGSSVPLSVQVFTLPPLPAVSQPGPLSLELRVASGRRGLQDLLKPLSAGLWSLMSNSGVLVG